MGFVDSLNRPGGNVTGVTFLANELEAKQLDLLSELVPRAEAIAYFVNPSNPNTATAVLSAWSSARTTNSRSQCQYRT
jgi:putative ABC transport system substrate-binding protein